MSRHAVDVFAHGDKRLTKLGLTHLISRDLLRREAIVLRQLSVLRSDILAKKYIRTASSGGYSQVRRREWDGVRQCMVTRIHYVAASPDWTVEIDMRDEYAARRRERALTRELAAIDALWSERYRRLGI